MKFLAEIQALEPDIETLDFHILIKYFLYISDDENKNKITSTGKKILDKNAKKKMQFKKVKTIPQKVSDKGVFLLRCYSVNDRPSVSRDTTTKQIF